MPRDLRDPIGSQTIDCAFPVQGETIPVDHGYPLYAALSAVPGVGPWLHDAADVAILSIRGRYVRPGRLQLNERSRLRLRLSAVDLPRTLLLTGKTIDIDGQPVTIGVPQTLLPRPAVALYAHVVTTRNGEDAQRFDAEIGRQLDAIEVTGKPTRGKRRVLRIKDKTVVGHSLLISELSADDSLRLQSLGLGGRRKMGCGVFVPWRG
ncbi:type I-MYXAN CRISPR-associated protein Cas6/Cmx6 [Thiococcus pfennigii]|uniref:type I-MYXAN CRISPR-associated protein Cas6/Cmx6 n=1 Tax=Thiococcus pfennigii TaxID=1057 RepID=UPI001904A8DC|nr:type I-MYXAN CRISPR-associated protein Cas6/Cmx6 [Thiococcus pfennigii]MBK1699593.1 type I-MYXAN CRISPR-associated protein Cas6/Cmx6 [Thiococcus pfennigii]